MLLDPFYSQINHDYFLYRNVLLFLISFISNTFSAISGGGAGLVQLPALILSGIPYYQALATHKVATVALGLGGSIRNFKSPPQIIHTVFINKLGKNKIKTKITFG